MDNIDSSTHHSRSDENQHQDNQRSNFRHESRDHLRARQKEHSFDNDFSNSSSYSSTPFQNMKHLANEFWNGGRVDFEKLVRNTISTAWGIFVGFVGFFSSIIYSIFGGAIDRAFGTKLGHFLQNSWYRLTSWTQSHNGEINGVLDFFLRFTVRVLGLVYATCRFAFFTIRHFVYECFSFARKNASGLDNPMYRPESVSRFKPSSESRSNFDREALSANKNRSKISYD